MTIKTAIATLFFTVLLAVMFAMIFEPVEPVDPYCEMVGIWIDSDGEYGWPDYRGDGECEL